MNGPARPEGTRNGGGVSELLVEGSCAGVRRTAVEALEAALAGAGCWVGSRAAIGADVVEISFEVPLRSALELYSGLAASGVQLSASGHSAMAGACTLLQHWTSGTAVRSPLPMRLRVRFAAGELDRETESRLEMA